MISNGAFSFPPRVYEQRRPGHALRPRRRSQYLPLVVPQGPVIADLAYDAGPDIRPVGPFGNVAHYEFDDVVLCEVVHLRRVVRVHVERTAHHDIHARGVGHPCEADRIAAYPDARHLDQRAAAELLVQPDLFDSRVYVVEPSVVPVRLGPVTYPAERLLRDRFLEECPIAGVRRRRRGPRAVEQDVLVGKRPAKIARLDRPQHGLHLAGQFTAGHGCPQ